jgi:penicillin-binding protein 2
MRRSPKETEDSARVTHRRALLLGGAMTAMFAVLGARMRYLSVDQADQFRLLAEENRISMRLIPPARGIIQDRNGKVLAGNEQNYRVVITREDAGDVDKVLAKLAHIIPLTADDLDRTAKEMKRTSPFAPITVADRLTWDDLSKIALNAPSLPGV